MRPLPRTPARVLPLVALVALAIVAARPAGAEDLETLRQRAQSVADEVTGFERKLADLDAKQERLGTEIEEANLSIASLELEIREVDEAYSRAYDTYVARAIESYKSGTTSMRLALLLSTRNLNDLMTVAEATSEVAELDERSLQELVTARSKATAIQERVDARKQRLLAAQSEALSVSRDIETTLARRSETLRSLRSEIAELEAEIKRQIKRQARAASESEFPGARKPTGKPDQELLEKLSGSGPSLSIPKGFTGTGVTFEGLASWYGPGFEGNSTANGDIFDSRLYTAASKELPLGTWLHIKHEGKGVVVLVNDRGPYVEPRILDLSRAAADAIGMVGKGVGWVRAEILVKA